MGITTYNIPGLKKGGGEGGTMNHDELNNRNLPNQHIISSITGLDNELLYNLKRIDFNDTNYTFNNLKSLLLTKPSCTGTVKFSAKENPLMTTATVALQDIYIWLNEKQNGTATFGTIIFWPGDFTADRYCVFHFKNNAWTTAELYLPNILTSNNSWTGTNNFTTLNKGGKTVATEEYVDGKHIFRNLNIATSEWVPLESKLQATVPCQGITLNSNVVISPTPESLKYCSDNQIFMSGLGVDYLIFDCVGSPQVSEEVSFNVLIVK